METNKSFDYEGNMIKLDDVLDLMEEAIVNHKPLSLGRYGHGEIAFIGVSEFPWWKKEYDTHGSYAGATSSLKTIKDDLFEALSTTDIIGLHTSWGEAWEDREAAKMTKQLFQKYDFKPTCVCSAFITHEMIRSERFWASLEGRKVALVGRRAQEAIAAFTEKGANITYTSGFEGYKDIEKVYADLSNREDWDVALLSAGIPATVLTPRLARQTDRVVIDFGHAIDKLLDGDNFNYLGLVQEWKEEIGEKALVSIVMSVYNGEKFVKEAIDSALSQTYKNIELIVVNDDSDDSTKAILDEIHDERLSVIHLEKNLGAANALNEGIRQAKGSWIAIQDADDNSLPSRIEEQIKHFIEHPQLVGVGSFIECIPGSPDVSEGRLIGFANKRNWFDSSEKIREKMYHDCTLTHSTVMYRKDFFWEVGGYNTEYKITYDYDLWFRFLENGEIENVPKVLLQYRINTSSLSHMDANDTVNEMQIAASRAIGRFLVNSGIRRQPRVIIIGPQKGCKNYFEHIAPASGLIVEALKSENSTSLVHYEIKKLNAGKIDAIIVLDGSKKESILKYLKRKNLELNVQVFNLYNILE